MKDRFDLEEAIQHVRATVEDIRTVNEMMYDSDMIWDDDKRWNVMEGLAAVMECKCNKLWDTFTQVHKLDAYSAFRCKFTDDDGNVMCQDGGCDDI